jgi:hypothetical protein
MIQISSLSTPIRAAMICGALAVTAGPDTARAQADPHEARKEQIRREQSETYAQDKARGEAGERRMHIRAQKQRRDAQNKEELQNRDAAFARSQRARADADRREQADRDGTRVPQFRRDPDAQRGRNRNAEGRHAQGRDKMSGRYAGGKPLRREYKHYRAERRQFGRAAARFVRNPRYGTYQRLGREYRQARAAHGKFHRAAVRYARKSHDAGARPLRRAYGHYRTERRQFHRAATRFARAPRYGNYQGLRRQFGQFRSARASFHRAAGGFARRR